MERSNSQIADLLSRPAALTIGVFFYTLGYIIVASSKTVDSVVGGQVIYTLGTTAINQVSGILIADITSLQWRGAVQGAYSLPWVLNAFVAGYITEDIGALSQEGWRWGVSDIVVLRDLPDHFSTACFVSSSRFVSLLLFLSCSGATARPGRLVVSNPVFSQGRTELTLSPVPRLVFVRTP